MTCRKVRIGGNKCVMDGSRMDPGISIRAGEANKQEDHRG